MCGPTVCSPRTPSVNIILREVIPKQLDILCPQENRSNCIIELSFIQAMKKKARSMNAGIAIASNSGTHLTRLRLLAPQSLDLFASILTITCIPYACFLKQEVSHA